MNQHAEENAQRNFAHFGPLFAKYGYPAIPIKRGEKVPEPNIRRVLGKPWTQVTVGDVDALAESFPDSYVGIVTGEVRAIDLDFLDELIAEKVMAYVRDRWPGVLIRRGKAPKLLFVFQAEDPTLGKRLSPWFFPPDVDMSAYQALDSKADKDKINEINRRRSRIEVLGKGQQFVAKAIHPDTEKPYLWRGGRPEDVPVFDLPVIREDEITELFTYVHKLAVAAGMQPLGDTVDTGHVHGGDKTAAEVVEGYDLGRTLELIETCVKLGIVDPERRGGSGVHESVPGWVDIGFAMHQQGAGSTEWRDAWANPDNGISWPDALCESVWASMHGGGFGIKHLVQRLHKLPDSADPHVKAAKKAFPLIPMSTPAKPEDFPPAVDDDDLPSATTAAEKTLKPDTRDPRLVPRDGTAAIAWFTKRFFYLAEGSKPAVAYWAVDSETGSESMVRMSYANFKELYPRKVKVGDGDNEKWKQAAQVWFESDDRESYMGVMFNPKTTKSTASRLNLFRGWGVKPQPAQDDETEAGVRRITTHILEVLASGNKTHAQYILHWCANVFQNPTVPAEVAVVLRSGQGTGKGMFANFIKSLAGSHGRSVADAEKLIGKHNAHLENCVFLFADEAFYAGDRKHVGALKSILTEPTMMIEPKFMDAVERKNMLHVMMATNEHWAVPADLDDRRFAVFGVSDHRVGDRAYFNQLAAAMRDPRVRAAFLHKLLTLNLGSASLRDIPDTEARDEQKTLSLKGFNAWLYEFLARDWEDESDAGFGWPGDPDDAMYGFWSTKELYRQFSEWRKDQRYGREGSVLAQNAFGRKLAEFWPQRRGREKTRSRGYVLGAVGSARGRFKEVTGLTIA
ncbi:MAG: bifunctional DNA primase/polymerase [Gammaproteobacteria bacterium]|nr:bifunctional DNA primase/polymerase [Gammaproteobacteria bacterium]